MDWLQVPADQRDTIHVLPQALPQRRVAAALAQLVVAAPGGASQDLHGGGNLIAGPFILIGQSRRLDRVIAEAITRSKCAAPEPSARFHG